MTHLCFYYFTMLCSTSSDIDIQTLVKMSIQKSKYEHLKTRETTTKPEVEIVKSILSNLLCLISTLQMVFVWNLFEVPVGCIGKMAYAWNWEFYCSVSKLTLYSPLFGKLERHEFKHVFVRKDRLRLRCVTGNINLCNP